MGSRGDGVVAVSMSEIYLLEPSNDMFAADAGAVKFVNCATRGDVALCADRTQLEYMRGRQADRVQVRSKGHKGVIRNTRETYGRGNGPRFAVPSHIIWSRRRCRCHYFGLYVMRF